MSTREKIMLRVERGALVPADEQSRERLNGRGLSVGDVVSAEITKPRNVRFHRLAFAIGRMCAENIEAFHGMTAYDALKKIQLDAQIACTTQDVEMDGVGKVRIVKPESLSFASMDQIRFHEVMGQMCVHLAAVYWPTMTAEQVEEFAQTFIE